VSNPYRTTGKIIVFLKCIPLRIQIMTFLATGTPSHVTFCSCLWYLHNIGLYEDHVLMSRRSDIALPYDVKADETRQLCYVTGMLTYTTLIRHLLQVNRTGYELRCS
jgi:hypothetical protein